MACARGSFTLILANALQVSHVPGRKSDVSDATWIADCLAHGLIRPSFVPPAPIQELRDLTRTRKQLVRETTQHTLRIQKMLEDANLKLTGVLTDILGVSGRAMLQALIAGETIPSAWRARPRPPQGLPRGAARRVEGRVTAHHRFLLQLHLAQIDALDAAVREVEARLGEALAPFRPPSTPNDDPGRE